MREYQIVDLTDNNEQEWCTFNEIQETGSIFHTLEWKTMIEHSHQLKSHYFMVYNEKEIIALCPFFEDKLKMFRGLFTLPHSDYSHIIFREQFFTADVIREILDKCITIANHQNLSFIQLTTLHAAISDSREFTFLPYPRFCTMNIDLEKTPPDEIWKHAFTNSIRRKVSAFQKDGFSIDEINSLEGLKLFYEMFLSNSEFQNFYLYPYSHFQALAETFLPDRMKILLLHKNGVYYGGLIFFLFPPQKSAYFVYVGINREALKHLPKVYHISLGLHWDAIQRLNRWGYRNVSLGKAPDDPENYYYHQKLKLGGTINYSYNTLLSLSSLFTASYRVFNKVRGKR